MSRARFEKPCAAAPARAIERAVRHLLAEGYGLEDQTEAQARLVYMRGSGTEVHLARYRLELAADGKSLKFEFHAGEGSSGYLTKKERSRLDHIATAAAAAALDPPPPTVAPTDEGSFRCRYCGALTPMEEPSCKACGAANFS